jgi:hypothetical protein
VSSISSGIGSKACSTEHNNKRSDNLDFGWSMIFKIVAIVGVVMTFLPDKKN